MRDDPGAVSGTGPAYEAYVWPSPAKLFPRFLCPEGGRYQTWLFRADVL